MTAVASAAPALPPRVIGARGDAGVATDAVKIEGFSKRGEKPKDLAAATDGAISPGAGRKKFRKMPTNDVIIAGLVSYYPSLPPHARVVKFS